MFVKLSIYTTGDLYKEKEVVILSKVQPVENTNTKVKFLKAFSVDDGWTGFIIFLFRDPHLLEGGKRS